MIFILIGYISNALFSKTYRNDLEPLYFHLSLLAISIMYFFIVILVLMPYFNHRTPQFFRYSQLGNTFPEILTTIINKPGTAIKLFFADSSTKILADGIKSELHIMVLLSGGVFLLYKPHYIIMLLPIYAQKMLSNDQALWGINQQYSIEFVPIISLCLIDSLTSINVPKKTVKVIIFIVLISTLASNVKTMYKRNSTWYQAANTVFWQKKHYTSEFNTPEIYKILRLIPDKVPLSASSPLVPHLCKREKIYQFPVINDAEYIAILKGKRGIYPLEANGINEMIAILKHEPEKIIVFENEDLVLFRKKSP
jgi:uncharacterized membrane protein